MSSALKNHDLNSVNFRVMTTNHIRGVFKAIHLDSNCYNYTFLVILD